MELLVNDLSIAGQFPDVPTFVDAIGHVMKMRIIAQRFGRELHCHRNMACAQVTRNHTLQQAIQHCSRDQQQAVMQWITQHGPFWEDMRAHSVDDWLECNGNIVTETSVGEAAYCCFHGADRHLVSLTPSSWEFTPVQVAWKSDAWADRSIDVTNHWVADELETTLRAAHAPIASWKQLAAMCAVRCPHLTCAVDSFEPLRGYPFVVGAAHRILVLLDTLNQFKSCFDDQGRRTPEGQRLYQDHFTGDNAWFSDSSDAEKRDFRGELTFRHPAAEGERLFCSWHGKVQTPQLRIHFSWPVRADEPLFVVYVGPKITKQ